MYRTKGMLKKVTAVTAASVIGLSGASSVMAATGQEAEKAALSRFITEFSEYWDASMADQEKAMAGANGKMTLKLEDGGKSLLSMMTEGMDYSWLNTLTLDVTASIAEGKEIADTELLLNDTGICNIKTFIDMAELTEYLQIPELSESWIKIPLMVSMEMAEDMDAEEYEEYQEYMEEYSENMSAYFKYLGNLPAILPETEVIATLLERYGNLVIDHMTETGSVEETLSVEGVEETCVAYDSVITEKGFFTMMNQILTTAKEDQELRGLLEQMSEVSGEDLTAQFQESMDEMLNDFTEEEAAESSDTPVISSRAWVNADGKIIGREIGMVDDTETIPIFTFKLPSVDGKTALLFEFGDPEEKLTFTGAGQSSDGLLNGDYVLASDGVKMFGIKAENLETAPEIPGYYNGNLTISVLDTGTPEQPNPLAAFGMNIKLTADAAAKTNQMDFTLTNSGAALVTLSVNGSYADKAVGMPEQEVLDAAVDYSSEEGGKAYFSGMNTGKLLENMAAAGVPEELVAVIDQMLQQAIAEALNPPAEATEEAA